MRPLPKRPMPFARIYGQNLLSSSLWSENSDVLKLFVTMLVAADEDGFVDVFNTHALCRMANLDLPAVENALAVLGAPDPNSRSKDREGRRVVRTEDGRWFVVNLKLYREYRTAAQIAEAERKSRRRNGTARPRGRPKKATKPATDEANVSPEREREIRAFDAVTGKREF